MRRLLLVLLLLWLPGTASAAPWVPPLAGPLAVDRAFSAPTTAYGAGHRGVDLRGTAGQSVRAAGAGRVTYAGLLAGRGVVTVTHADGLRTTYEPVTVSVRAGQPVGVGSPLGTLAGGHCRDGGACLHWGLLRGEAYLDPMSLPGAAGVRLLPLDGSMAAGGAPAGGSSAGAGAAAAGSGPPAGVGPETAPALARPVQRLAPAGPPRSPHLVLRAADQASGAAAILLFGLGLLMLIRRPGTSPPPHQPATPAAVAFAPDAGGAPEAPPVDLQAERTRRRTAQRPPGKPFSGDRRRATGAGG